MTDGSGLVLVRRVWDWLGLGEQIDQRAGWLRGRFRPSLMVEIWSTLLLYGGSCMDHLPWLGHRGVRRLFGWKAVPNATTMGRWLRRAGDRFGELLDELLWEMVVTRWRRTGVPDSVMLLIDSTVVVRFGEKQAGAEKGYNPKKPGRPCHHPMLAFLAETGDCLGVRWRSGRANTAAGAIPWIELLVSRLRAAGVKEITVRLDKGFYSRAMMSRLDQLGVKYVLKMANYRWVKSHLSPFQQVADDPRLWTAFAPHHGVRLLTVQERAEVGREGELQIGDHEVVMTAHLVTNIEGIDALGAWRLYNSGTVVEQRIKEMAQLSVGATAVDDLGGNSLLWSMGAVAYQLLHTLRECALTGSWRRAQPERLRAWLFRMPGKLTRHARSLSLQLRRDEPLRSLLFRALDTLPVGPPLPA
jgi:hypothetical protein